MVLSTDGTISYAAFIYEDSEAIREISETQPLVTGLSAGDGERFTNVMESVDGSIVFRIDGKPKVTYLKY